MGGGVTVSKEITNHGQAGYRRGCRCEACRSGHRDAARRYREGKRKPVVKPEPLLAPLVDVPEVDTVAPAGPIESALARELEALVGEPPWKRTLSAMLLGNAKVLDQVAAHERFDVISGLQTRMLDMMDRLRKVADGGASAPADLSALLGEPD